MRKEIVAVTNQAGDLVRHDGAWYRKVARRAHYGELVLRRETGVWKVYSTDGHLDNLIQWRDNIRYKIKGIDSSRYTTLEPLDTSATGDYHEHEGALYRKERRKAQVGETVLATALDSRFSGINGVHGLFVGGVYSVEMVVCDGVHVVTARESGAYVSNAHDEYVVLVPIAHAAPVEQEPPTIAYHDEFLGATRESVFEVWARGKAAMARKEAQDASERLKAISEKARTVRVTTAEDADLLADYTQQSSSLYRQAAYWMREESKYTDLADAAAAKIKERKVA